MAVEISLLNSNSVDNINTNFERVAAALVDTVGRSGNTPNQMNTDLDMNGNDILNIQTLQVQDLTIDGTNPEGILERALDAAEEAEAAAALAISVAGTFPVGGTTGQALVKSSNVDYAYTWATVGGGGFTANISVATRTDLKALDTTVTKSIILREGGREGVFVWLVGDYSAQVTADPQEGVYIKADAIATTLGVWARVYDRLLTSFFGGSPSATATANVTAFQAAITYAEIYTGALHIPSGSYSFDAGLVIAATINLTGDGMNKSVMTFTHSGASTYGLKIEPDGRTNNNTFSSWSGFMVVASSASYGIWINLTGSEYLSNFTMERVYTIGSQQGLRANGTGITGGLFSCTFRRCWFANGVNMTNVGDSITILENTINGNGIGIFITLISGARQLIIRNNNITTLAECIYTLGVVGAQIESNWMETPSYLGSYTGASGSICYISGSTNTRVYGNTIQPLDEVGGGFVGANYAVACVGVGDGNIFDDNDIADGVLGHFQIDTVTNTVIGDKNVYPEARVIADTGQGTIGVRKTPTLSGAWVAYSAGTYPTLTYKKLPTGNLKLQGAIKSGSGTLFTLPLGFRPTVQQMVSYFNPVDGTDGYVSISTAGVVSLVSGSVTGCFFDCEIPLGTL